MKKVIEFVKKETVLSIAFLMAVISAFIVPIDVQYISYMDFRVLVLLFTLMAVMGGLQSLGIFEKLSYALLKYVKSTRSLTLLLVSLCFFLAMLITNDVALITFVPFTILILEKVDKPGLLIPIIVLETIAANLGSMLTPVGNPQNLYLYGLSGLSIQEFLLHMAPATVLSFGLLLIWIFLQKKENKNKNWLLKTEYFGAFPEFEIEMLNRGWHLAYVENITRWCLEEDLDRKKRFAEFLASEYGLYKKCMPVGMSCGGLIAVKFAARYPQLVSCVYIDAPVINYMSCPCGFGIGERIDDEEFSEILGALGMSSISELICYRDMPLDNIPELVKHKIPIVMVSGDSDTIVPYTENGIMLEKAYKENNSGLCSHQLLF